MSRFFACECVRFDPAALQDSIFVYRPSGAFLCQAPCVAAVGFFDTDGTKAQARLQSQLAKTTKAQTEAIKKMSAHQVAAALPQIDQHEPPAPRVVRLVSAGNTVRKIEAADPFHEPSANEAAMLRAWAQQHGGPRLVPDTGDD